MRKSSVALVIWQPGGSLKLLAVKRPETPGEELPGIWGLPAGSQRPGESLQQTALRVGRDKLGVQVVVGRTLATGTQRRQGYELDMTLVEAAMPAGESLSLPPEGQSRQVGITYYTAYTWAEPSLLEEGARRGSLCCQLLLDYVKRRERATKQTAVIDRFEGDTAVLLVGDEERELMVPRVRLPTGIRAGVWLTLYLDEGKLIDVQIDEEETKRRLRRIESKLLLLRAKDKRGKKS